MSHATGHGETSSRSAALSFRGSVNRRRRHRGRRRRRKSGWVPFRRDDAFARRRDRGVGGRTWFDGGTTL